MKNEITISSIKDERVIEARSLQSSRGRLSSGKFLLEGEEQIAWALERLCSIEHLFVHDKLKNHPFLEICKAKNIPFYFASDGILKKITDTSYLVPFVGIGKKPLTKEALQGDLVVVFDGVKDFGNVGTIVRTAFAFGIQEFASTGGELDLFYKKTIDASRGTVFASDLHAFGSGKEAIVELKKHGYQIAVTTTHRSELQSFAKLGKGPVALVFGNETNGASEELLETADLRIQIPMAGDVESLNVGVAAGISLYEMKIKLVLAMLIEKIHESAGRSLSCASRWIKLVFDAKLKELSPFNADQAIAMMVLKCDRTSSRTALAHDAGISPNADWNALLDPLIAEKYIAESGTELSLTEKGEEALAKIWSIHEWAERAAFEHTSAEERAVFQKVIEKIFLNCEKIVPFS